MTTAATSACFHCGTSVHPTAEGFCPACTQQFRLAEPDQQSFEHRPPWRQGATSGDRFWVKVAIVLLVFPTLQWVISLLWGLLFVLPVLWIALSVETQEILQIVAQLIGVVGAILICRKIWPSSD